MPIKGFSLSQSLNSTPFLEIPVSFTLSSKKIGFFVFPMTFLMRGGDGYFLEQRNVLSLSLNKSVAQLSN